MNDKMEEAEIPELLCITGHPGLHAVCLNVLTLQTAYYQYRQEYGSATLPLAINEWVLFVFKDHAITLDTLHTSIYIILTLQLINDIMIHLILNL